MVPAPSDVGHDALRDFTQFGRLPLDDPEQSLCHVFDVMIWNFAREHLRDKVETRMHQDECMTYLRHHAAKRPYVGFLRSSIFE